MICPALVWSRCSGGDGRSTILPRMCRRSSSRNASCTRSSGSVGGDPHFQFACGEPGQRAEIVIDGCDFEEWVIIFPGRGAETGCPGSRCTGCGGWSGSAGYLRRSGMLGGVDSEPGPPRGRRREIDARLDAVRARLGELRKESRTRSGTGPSPPASGWTRRSAMRPRRMSVSPVHERAAAAGIGDVGVTRAAGGIAPGCCRGPAASRACPVGCVRAAAGGTRCCRR